MVDSPFFPGAPGHLNFSITATTKTRTSMGMSMPTVRKLLQPATLTSQLH